MTEPKPITKVSISDDDGDEVNIITCPANHFRDDSITVEVVQWSTKDMAGVCFTKKQARQLANALFEALAYME